MTSQVRSAWLLTLPGALELPVDLALDVGEVAPVVAVVLVEVHCAAHDFVSVLRQQGTCNGENEKSAHSSLYGEGAARVSPRYAERVNPANREPARTIVWLRSGPVEMQPISTPIRLSRNAR